MTNTHVVVPAWWDPKQRKAIWDDSTIVCGILVAGADGVVFAGPEGIAFDLPTSGLEVAWVKLGTACRISRAGVSYLVYLMPPTDGSPRLSRSSVLQIAQWLDTADNLANLADEVADLGFAADVFGVGGLLGNSIRTISSVAAMRRARASKQALQQTFAYTV